MNGAPIRGSERLIAMVGPSGAGKDSVLAAWRCRLGPSAAVHFVQRVVTRPAGPGEDHEAIDGAAFATLETEGELAIAWRANGLAYGVRAVELEPLATGRWVVLNMSREALPALRRRARRLKVVELRAPSDVLRRRLEQRGRESEATIEARLARRTPPVAADLVLVNADTPLPEIARALHAWWRRLANDPGHQ